jgi:hypothetical protein
MMLQDKKSTKKSGELLSDVLWIVGVFLAFVVISVSALWLYSSYDDDSNGTASVSESNKEELTRGQEHIESERRFYAAKRFVGLVEEHYQKHGSYPLPDQLVLDKEIQGYLKSSVISYRLDKTRKEWFVVGYKFAGGFGWSGSQYTNKPEILNLPAEVKLEGPGWYILDLH